MIDKELKIEFHVANITNIDANPGTFNFVIAIADVTITGIAPINIG